MILSIKKSVLLFPFVCLIFIQHRSIAAPGTLSKQNDGPHWNDWNANAEFHTVRYNLSIDRILLKRYFWHVIPTNMTPTTENETCYWTVDFFWDENKRYSDSQTSLDFQLVDGGKAGRAFAKLKAALLDDFGREVHSKEDFLVLDAGGEKIRWGHFIDFDDMNRNPSIKKNPFIISVEISYYYSPRRNLTDQQNMISPEPNYTKCLLSDNIGSSLGNPDFADVMLLVNGKNYWAHRVILAARSEVFATMFKNTEHGDKKHKKIRIDITDIDADVMDEVLRYIYTGKCQISDELADRLYAAADAYKLNGLKTIILQSMVDTLSIESAAHVLILADKHHEKDLKSKVIDFIVENSIQVLNTTEWKSMAVPNNVQLVDEMCKIFSQRLSKSLPCVSFCKLALANKLK
ncbi:speckle-type POZ protein B-like [Planococcus citri]|uniref:speckle-type POZ protein B-like n=1 Tax=Planococcus citri TaxID=170843 RepID=UPI0031F9B870